MRGEWHNLRVGKDIEERVSLLLMVSGCMVSSPSKRMPEADP